MDATFGGGLRGVQGEGIVILTVGDHQDDTRKVRLSPKTSQRFTNGRFEVGAPASHTVGTHGFQDQTEKSEVGGQRTEHGGPTGKRNETHMVPAEIGQQILNLCLGTSQPVGGHVLSQHGTGHIKGNHQLGAHPWCSLVMETPLGSHQGQDQGEGRKPYQSNDEKPAPAAWPQHQSLLH